MKFGIRNVTDVTFKATSDGQRLGQTSFNKYDPILFLNSGKISTLESSVSTVYAQGGRGHPRILGWDGDRVVTLSFEDALMSPRSITALSGAGLLSNSTMQLHLTEKVGALDATDYVLDFNGSTDYVRADNEITAYPFTLETWVKFDSVGSTVYMMSINSANNGSRYWTIGLISLKLIIKARNTTPDTVSGTTTVSADTWYHVAGVFASDTDRRLYLNGVLEASDTSSVTFFNSITNQVLLGTFRTSSIANVLDGKLSDARIWNTERTPAEILANYEQRLIGNESGLVGYWKLEEGYSDVLFDSTSNRNNGIPINVPTTWIEDSTVPLKGAAAQVDNIKGNVTLLSSAAIKVMTLDDFDSVTELTSFSIATNTASGPSTTQLSVYGISTTPVLIDFYSEQIGNKIIIEPETFSGYYYIEANTTFLGTDGIERNAMFTIPKGKIRSNFTFNINAYGEPSTFDFVVDAFPGETRFNSLKKVLFVLEVSSTISGFTSPLGVPSLMAWYDATEIDAQGYSLDFDGTNDYAQAVNEITAYPFTLETWVKFDVVNVHQSILFLSNSTVFNIYYGFGLNATGKLFIQSRNTTDTVISGTTNILANTWIHLACVFTSDTSKTLYLNGVSEITQTTNISFSSSNIVVLMGLFRTTSPSSYFNGKLSDVRVWNTVRTEAEILDNYNKRLIGNETGLVGYWKLDEGNSTAAKDYTTNANDASLINGTIWDTGEPFTGENISDYTGVRIWKDKSVNGYNATQTTSANRPTYRTNQINGKPALVFDGTDDFLSLSGGALGILRNVAGATIFAVVKYENTLSVKILFDAKGGTGSFRINFGTDGGNQLRLGGRRLDADSFQQTDSPDTTSTSFFLQTGLIDYQNTLLRLYVNTILKGENTSFQTSGNTSDTDSTAITISGTSGFLNGAIAELIIYNRALNDTELFWINAYLKEKYGL